MRDWVCQSAKDICSNHKNDDDDKFSKFYYLQKTARLLHRQGFSFTINISIRIMIIIMHYIIK